MENKPHFIDYQIKVNWNKNIRKFWKIYPAADLHKFFTVNLNLHTSNDLVDVNNDVLVIRPHYMFEKDVYELLDKGIKFIYESLWECRSDIFEKLLPYSENGIAIIAGMPQKLEGWKRIHFAPMSFWYLEYFRRRTSDIPPLKLSQKTPTHDFLMPVRQKKYYRDVFINLLGKNLDKAIYSMLWKGISLPNDVIMNIENQDILAERFCNLDWYNSTFYSMVIETFQEKPVFITEKTFKPIMYGHPFMIYGSNEILKTLHDYGFHTFPELFDESYDNEEDPVIRAKLIIKQIEKFNSSILTLHKKSEIDQKIFENFYKFYNREEVLDIIIKEVRNPIEAFLNE